MALKDVPELEVVVDEPWRRVEAVAGVTGEAALDGHAQGGGEAREDAHADVFEPLARVGDALGEGDAERLRGLFGGKAVEGGEELADLARDRPAAGPEERDAPQRPPLDDGVAREGPPPPFAHPLGDGHGRGQAGRDQGQQPQLALKQARVVGRAREAEDALAVGEGPVRPAVPQGAHGRLAEAGKGPADGVSRFACVHELPASPGRNLAA